MGSLRVTALKLSRARIATLSATTLLPTSTILVSRCMTTTVEERTSPSVTFATIPKKTVFSSPLGQSSETTLSSTYCTVELPKRRTKINRLQCLETSTWCTTRSLGHKTLHIALM